MQTQQSTEIAKPHVQPGSAPTVITLDEHERKRIEAIAEDYLTRATMRIISDHPFFSTALLSKKKHVHWMMPTMGVNSTDLFYNPLFVKELYEEDRDYLHSVLAHEVLHVLMGHTIRRGTRPPMKWNVAADFAINWILKENRFKIHPGWLLDEKYANMSAEKIYDLLPDINMKMQMFDENGNPITEDELAELEAKGVANFDPGGMGVALDETAKMEEVKEEIAKSMAVAKAAGKVPSGIMGEVNATLRGKQDWREILRDFVTIKCKDDYSMRRPNRRFISEGIYLSSLDGERAGEIVVAVDNSSSINLDIYNQFISELSCIVEDIKPEKVTVLYCNAAINKISEYEPEDMPITGAPKPSGGTRFEPVFNWIEQEDREPMCLIYFTDMCASIPQDVPDYPVIWAVEPGYGNYHSPDDLPYGEYVEIHKD